MPETYPVCQSKMYQNVPELQKQINHHQGNPLGLTNALWVYPCGIKDFEDYKNAQNFAQYRNGMSVVVDV